MPGSAALFVLTLCTLTTVEAAYPAEGLQLKLPVNCKVGRACAIQHYVDHDPHAAARDYACGRRTYDGHDGTDFRLPDMKAQRAGVDVLAAAPGRVARTRDGIANISVHTVGRDAVKGKECGNGVIIDHAGGWQTQYCHLDQQTVNLKPGDEVKAGQPIGRVGLSGFAEFPHLHFTVRQHSVIVDPFAYGADQNSCASGLSLWAHPAEDGLTYTPAEVLNIGIATGPVTMEAIEMGTIGDGPPSLNSAALVAFARAIGLRAGDVPRVTLTGANGQLLADAAANPLDYDKAQYIMFAGKPRPAAGWPSGSYRVIFSVRRNHSRLIERSLDLVL